jgi:hypothetical protein
VNRGIDRIDRVELNRDSTVARAIHDRPGNAELGLGSTGTVNLALASRQPIAASSRQYDRAAALAPTLAATPQPERRHPGRCSRIDARRRGSQPASARRSAGHAAIMSR